jgi:hypothetical protein
MTPQEAAATVQLLTQMWPQPELEATGLKMLIVAVVDTGLSEAEAQAGIRALLQEHHEFRPSVAQLKTAAKPSKPAYHRPYLVRAIEAPPPPDEVVRAALDTARSALRGGK